jgi:hypothetical protein
MKKAKLIIRMDNAAFEGDGHQELARILHDLANELEGTDRSRIPLFDINGNKVGTFVIN